MKTSPAGIAAIKRREGVRLVAYPDPAMGGDPWTIGVGHTGPDVYPDKRINNDESDALLAADLVRFEKGVERLVKVPLTQNQFDALVSFAFNVGLGNLESSTLLKRLNAKDYAGAADQFLRWNRAGGKEMAGLTTRRQDERKQFTNGV